MWHVCKARDKKITGYPCKQSREPWKMELPLSRMKGESCTWQHRCPGEGSPRPWSSSGVCHGGIRWVKRGNPQSTTSPETGSALQWK